MNRKIKLSLLILLLTAYAFVSSFSNVKAQRENFTLIYDNGLLVTLETPWYVYSNSTFNVTLTVKAAEANLENIVLNLTRIITFVDENETSPSYEPKIFQIGSLNINRSESYQINITLPENSSRVVMGEVACKWNIRNGTTIFFQRTMFPIAVIADVWKERVKELQDRITELEGNLTDLQRELNETRHQLESKMGELGVTQRLAVIFGVTTALFVFTTIYLFKRKPQIW
ncbi:hypothetical protein DRO54_09920 [Candidatus Bathyarchaeota archaeon]|nr:MAG: hypothetical protein DRO54_09920 [Candidatus Bathyarchaeota archaeon]